MEVVAGEVVNTDNLRPASKDSTNSEKDDEDDCVIVYQNESDPLEISEITSEPNDSEKENQNEHPAAKEGEDEGNVQQQKKRKPVHEIRGLDSGMEFLLSLTPETTIGEPLFKKVKVEPEEQQEQEVEIQVEIMDESATPDFLFSMMGESTEEEQDEDGVQGKRKECVEGFDEHQDTKESIASGNPMFKYQTNIYRKHRPTGEIIKRPTRKCWYCPSHTFSLNAYHAHKLHHLQNFEMKCAVCTFSCETEVQMVKHLKCHEPGYSDFNNYDEVVEKDLKSKQRLPYGVKCTSPNCPAISRTKDLLRIHMARHEVSSKYKCKWCSFSCPNWLGLAAHEGMHKKLATKISDETRIIEPGSPPRKSPQKAQSSPIKVKAKKIVLKCPNSKCTLSFLRQTDFDRHLITHDKNRVKSQLMQKSKSAGMFPISPKVLTTTRIKSKSSSKGHFLRRRKRKAIKKIGKPEPILKYSCPISNCPAKFAISTEVRAHQQRHEATGNKHKCNKCSYTVNQDAFFKRHQQLHEKEEERGRARATNPADTVKAKMNDSKGEKTPTSQPPRPSRSSRSTRSSSESFKFDNAKTKPVTIVKDPKRSCEISPKSIETKRAFVVLEKSKPDVLKAASSPKIARVELEIVKEKATEKVQQATGSQNQNLLISSLKMKNFMGQRELSVNFASFGSSLYCAQGGSNSGKTTLIVACLLALGYDVLLDLQPGSTICGVQIDCIVRNGKEYGFVEATLNLSSYPELVDIYGHEIVLRRELKAGVHLEDTEIVLSCRDQEPDLICFSELQFIMEKILPSFLWRVMVLNAENVQYLTENFYVCKKLFHDIANEKGVKLREKLGNTNEIDLKFVKSELNTLKLRISYLQESLQHACEQRSCRSQLQVLHAKELAAILEQRAKIKALYKQLLKERDVLNEQIADKMMEFIDTVRKPFRKFLHAQNLMGDLVFGNTDDTEELILWVKDASSTSSTKPVHAMNMEEARQIWDHMTFGRKKLAVMGLVLSIWRVISHCPVLLGDLYSTTTRSEFNLPESAWSAVYSVIREESDVQFILSMPGKNRQDFVTKFT